MQVRYSVPGKHARGNAEPNKADQQDKRRGHIKTVYYKHHNVYEDPPFPMKYDVMHPAIYETKPLCVSVRGFASWYIISVHV